MEVRSAFTGRRGVCLPFSDSCEPLIFDREVVHVVKDRVMRFALERRWKHWKSAGANRSSRKALQRRNFTGIRSICAFALRNSSTAASSPVRRAIRKAQRNDVGALVVRNRQGIDDFYRLHAQTRQRHGLPPQPFSFFLNIYEHIIEPGLGFVVLAHRGSRPIAGAISSVLERTVYIVPAL